MYAVIVNGVVENIVAWSGFGDWYPDVGESVSCPDYVGIGWKYINGEFFKPDAPVMTIDQVYQIKYSEMKNGCDEMISLLESNYTDVERREWPKQEAGARIITGQESEVFNVEAANILDKPALREKAKATVETLAKARGVNSYDLSMVIIEHARTAELIGNYIWMQQAQYEAAIKKSYAEGDFKALSAIDVKYSLPPAV